MFWTILRPKAQTSGRHLRPPWSLAARLMMWCAGSAFALVLVATGILYWALVSNCDDQDDEFLADEAHIISDLLSERPGYVDAIKQEVEWESASRHYARVYVRLLDEHRGLLAETPDMSKQLPLEVFPAPISIEDTTFDGLNVKSKDGTSYRLYAAQTTATSRIGSRIIQVAVDRSRLERLLAQYRIWLAAVLAITLLACCLSAYMIARRGLRPIFDISSTVQRVRSTTLHERIQAQDFPAELSALAATFNEMLDRLQESFDRLSRFSADIAHELRTPVNNLRGEAEVALSKSRSLEEYREVLGSCLEESVRLSRMIDGLLLMAKAETPEYGVPRELVDVATELTMLKEFYEAAAADAGISLEVDVEPHQNLQVNRPLFQRAIGNLIENAIRYTPIGGRIKVISARENGRLRIQVSDTGCGIPEEHVTHVFDRFYRAESDRSSETGGTGLGLAIVRSVARLHGGAVTLDSEVGKGTNATILLPCS